MSYTPADPPSVSASDRPTPRWVIAGWTVVALIAPIVLALVHARPDLDRQIAMPLILYSTLVAAIAMLGAAAALVIIVSALQARDEHTLAIGLGILSGTIIILIHSFFDAMLPNAPPELSIVGFAMTGVFIVLSAFGPLSLSHDQWQRRVRRHLALGASLLIAGAVWSFADRLAPTPVATVYASAAVTGVACSIEIGRAHV